MRIRQIRMLEHLHSTMYLLNRCGETLYMNCRAHLHSTMYLLNPYSPDGLSYEEINLHSTMYLLNRGAQTGDRKAKQIYIPLCIY